MHFYFGDMVISGIQIVITGRLSGWNLPALSNNNQGRSSVKESYEKIFEDLVMPSSMDRNFIPDTVVVQQQQRLSRLIY